MWWTNPITGHTYSIHWTNRSGHLPIPGCSTRGVVAPMRPAHVLSMMYLRCVPVVCSIARMCSQPPRMLCTWSPSFEPGGTTWISLPSMLCPLVLPSVGHHAHASARPFNFGPMPGALQIIHELFSLGPSLSQLCPRLACALRLHDIPRSTIFPIKGVFG